MRASRPNYVWMTDITTIPSLFRMWMFKLVVVLDVYSRFPLAFRVFSKEPTSEQIAALVGEAVARHGKPVHFVTDQGPQHTGAPFTSKLADLGIKLRHGAIGQSGSIAIIERFWRTLKELLDIRFLPPISSAHLHDRVELALHYYATLRPHQGLGGATPAETYSPPRNDSAAPPSPSPPTLPDPGGGTVLPFGVAFAGGNRRMPYLVPNEHAA